MGTEHKRTPAQDKAALHVVQALKEGWGIHKLAAVAGVSTTTAGEALAKLSETLAKDNGEALGCLVDEMRVVARRERPAVVRRLEKVGKLCDSLILKAETILEGIETEVLEPFDDGEGKPPAQIMPEDRLLKLASAIQKAAASAGQCWASFRSASGLELAETVQAAGLVAREKANAADKSVKTCYEVEVIFPD